jgi:hypothetical protein
MPLDPKQVQMAFLAAVEMKDAAARKSLLDRLCAGDAELRQRVEELLAADEQGESFLEHPPVAVEAFPVTSASFSAGPGTMVGRYKLVEQIGEGGMGTVFMASQTTPVKRTVAVKIVKPGMDSRGVLAPSRPSGRPLR